MSGLSLYHRDGLLPPPPTSSACAGCAKAETEIRSLLDLIAASFRRSPSAFLGFVPSGSEQPLDFSDLFHRWLRKFESDPRFPLCPDLKKQIQALVYQLILDHRPGGGPPQMGSCRKRKSIDDGLDDGPLEMLSVLKRVATDACDQDGVNGGWKRRVLNLRRARFLKFADVSNADELPYPKKQRIRKFLSARNGSLGSYAMQNNSVRRSQRTLLKIGNSEQPRKRIPVGPDFQADVPDWTGPPTKEDMSDDRRLGTPIWPREAGDRKIDEEMIGKAKAIPCNCTSPGSVECVRLHVKMARLRLKSELGPSFSSLGFAEMGEDVSMSWTQEEQLKFDDIVRQNPFSEGKDFWEPALEYFTSKRWRDLVSFYFNVFILRWMSVRTRLGAQLVESSDDENLGWV